MNTKHISAFLFAFTLACSTNSEPAQTPSPSGAISGASNKISFTVTSEKPPQAGENTFKICLATLPKGEAIQGATLTLQTWMPSMGHGGPTIPSPSELGGGCYQATPVTFSMPGLWELHLHATGNSMEDTATLSYEIP